MSDTRTIIDMYLNVNKADRQSLKSGGFSDPPTLNLRRGTQALFRCHLMLDDATTYYQPPAGCTWYFGIDDAYTRDKADIVSSANSQFIAADWTDSDFLNGKVCWRCDFTTQALKDSVADAGNKSMYAALWMTPSGGLPALMGHWDINMRNIAVDPTSVGAVAGVVFDTVDRADSTYQKQKPDQGTIWFKNGKDPLIYCTTTGFYYPIVAVDVGGGIIQFVPGTGEAIS